jgi:hypothetical protein
LIIARPAGPVIPNREEQTTKLNQNLTSVTSELAFGEIKPIDGWIDD